MTLPTFQGAGTGSETAPAWPTHLTGDLGILAVEHGSGTVATPSGYTIVPGSPIVQGATTLSLFSKVAESAAEGAPSLSGGTDHMWGVMLVVRGQDTTDFLHALATAISTGATTSGFAPGTRTDEADCLVLHVLAWNADNAGPIASSWANASLANVAEQYDAGTVTGNGGGLTVASGELATAGVVAIGTVTLTSTGFAVATLAIRPPVTPPASEGGFPSVGQAYSGLFA